MPNRVPKACVTVCRWPAPACVNLRCAADWSASGACSRVPLACASVCQTARPTMAFLHRTNDSKVGPSLRLNLLATCPSSALACAGVWFWRVPERGSGVCRYIWRVYSPTPNCKPYYGLRHRRSSPKGSRGDVHALKNAMGRQGCKAASDSMCYKRGRQKLPSWIPKCNGYV